MKFYDSTIPNIINRVEAIYSIETEMKHVAHLDNEQKKEF